MQRIYLKDKCYQVEALPSEPALLVELIDLCHNDAATFEMFAEAIGKDVSLTSKVLQVANSPAYRQWNDATDLRRILIVLGLQNVKQIVISNAIQHFFASFGSRFDRNLQFLWFRSLVCAFLAKCLASRVGYPKPDEAYLAGLLHQVGQLLFLLNHKKDYPPVLRQYYQVEDFCQLEKTTFGVDHCELGSALADTWGLDSFIAEAILFQCATLDELGSAPTLLKIIAAAGPLSSQNFESVSPDCLNRAGQLLDQDDAQTLECLATALEQSSQMVETLGYNGELFIQNNVNTTSHSDQDQQHQSEAEAALAERIKQLALTRGAIQTQGDQLEELARDARLTFASLFGYQDLLFFRADSRQRQLLPIKDLKLHQLDDLCLPYSDSKSLLVKCFTESRAIYLEKGQGPILDQQILKLLRNDAAQLLPLQSGGEMTGLLAIGVPNRERAVVESKLPFLELLAKEFARAQKLLQDKTAHAAGLSETEFQQLAHEVSNPLTIIKNYLYLLSRKIEQDHPAQEDIDFINEEIDRAGDILLRAKDPDRQLDTGARGTDLNGLISSLDALLRNSLYQTRGTESRLDLAPEIPLLLIPEDRLKQVLLNLLKNAAEALDEGGLIQVGTRDQVIQNGRRYVEISVRDDGPGIPPEVLAKLFQPVASSKPGHSGLGLSIVSQLVSELSGSISCYSTPAKGTEFKVLLPRDVVQPEED